jgi:hypothetical protein
MNASFNDADPRRFGQSSPISGNRKANVEKIGAAERSRFFTVTAPPSNSGGDRAGLHAKNGHADPEYRNADQANPKAQPQV